MTDPHLLLRLFALALAVWREARGEPLVGKLHVAQTIENRVQDPRWPDTYLGVITQPWQFSAFNRNDPNALLYPTENDPVWPDCVAAADFVLTAPTKVTTANHYHTKAVSPAWKRDEKVVGKVGSHIFYEL